MVDEEFEILAINSTNTDLFQLLYCTLLCTGVVGCNPGDAYVSKHLLNLACNCTHLPWQKKHQISCISSYLTEVDPAMG